MDQEFKMPLGTEVGLGPGDVVLDGDTVLPRKKGEGAHPQFAAHTYCGQTAGWIKMPLGTEVDLGPGHIMLDGDPLRKGALFPFSDRMSVVAKRSPIQLLLSICCNLLHQIWRLSTVVVVFDVKRRLLTLFPFCRNRK